MSNKENIINNSKWDMYNDLESVTTEIESNLKEVNKNFIKKMLITLNSIIAVVHCKQEGIFKVLVKWFQLYLKLFSIVNPEDKKLLNYYENSVPTVISYVIGCLQYTTKDVPDYHLRLLEILEELVEDVPQSVLKTITNFEIGTIGYLWRVIDLAGNFNTQLKVLKILSVLLKQLDVERRNEEIKSIKWTKFNLFEDKLRTVVQETNLSHVWENASRDLLNNHNMIKSKNILVFSFYCKSIVLGFKYKFYKPLNLQKFWIDINHRAKTLSYSGRFKLDSNSKFENVNVVLKIQKIILEENILNLYFEKPGDFSKYSNYFANVEPNIIQLTLTHEESQRLIGNHYVLEYFKNLGEVNSDKQTETNREDKSTLQGNESIISPERRNCSESNNISDVIPLSAKAAKNENAFKTHPTRNLRDREKFFSPLATECSDEEFLIEKVRRKRKPKRKLRQAKKRQTPTVDLTKTENFSSLTLKQIRSKNDIENPLGDTSILTAQSYSKVLKEVADIYEIRDETYAKHCQSYRDFKSQLNHIQTTSNTKSNTNIKGRKQQINLDSESSIEKKRKINCESTENI